MNPKTIHKFAFILVLVGGINWGLVGLLNINLVTALFAALGLEDIIYILIGAAALYLLVTYNKKK